MDRKGSPLEVTSTLNQDSIKTLVDCKMEKCEEGTSIPDSIERENVVELDSMVAMMVADIVSDKEASPPRAEAPTDYSTKSWIYDAFQPMEGTEIVSREESDQSFNMSSLDSSQIEEPAFGQFYGLSGHGTQHYGPESTMAFNASTGDMSAYQSCALTTSQAMRVAMASSSSIQQLGREASCKRELRLIKNRQAAKESRRRKKEYVKYLEAKCSMLQLQNRTLRNEVNYLKGLFEDEQ